MNGAVASACNDQSIAVILIEYLFRELRCMSGMLGVTDLTACQALGKKAGRSFESFHSARIRPAVDYEYFPAEALHFPSVRRIIRFTMSSIVFI